MHNYDFHGVIKVLYNENVIQISSREYHVYLESSKGVLFPTESEVGLSIYAKSVGTGVALIELIDKDTQDIIYRVNITILIVNPVKLIVDFYGKQRYYFYSQ